MFDYPAAGSRVTVHRTSGDIEDDWYLWTDMSLASESMAFSAPEVILVMVIKPNPHVDLADILSGESGEYIAKKVPLSTLMSWQ